MIDFRLNFVILSEKRSEADEKKNFRKLAWFNLLHSFAIDIQR